ncbi:GNAT family N-acetyltransferase [Vagococcus sp.]|uniref:GNAT family N-acetyltransferase n=1 Tax=Vagococcus sp. TaxID=1933889 RepID=UPI003F9E0513
MGNQINKITVITKDHFDLLLAADPSNELVQRYLKNGLCFEYSLEDELVGVLVLLKQLDSIEIINLSIAEKFQRQGYATQFIEFSKKWTLQHNVTTLKIATGSTSFHQLYLYQKLGFRMYQIDPDFFIKNYSEPIYENGLHLKDRIQLKMKLI